MVLFCKATNHSKASSSGWNLPIFLIFYLYKWRKTLPCCSWVLSSSLKMFARQWQNNITSNKKKMARGRWISKAMKDKDASYQPIREVKKRWNGKIKTGCLGKWLPIPAIFYFGMEKFTSFLWYFITSVLGFGRPVYLFLLESLVRIENRVQFSFTVN